MNNWAAYILGVLTPFVVFGVGFCLLVALGVVTRLFNAAGWSAEFKWKRTTDRISNFTLKHDIWFEKQYGPVFLGHWYREIGDYAYVNRWIGFGPAQGTNLMIFKKRNLGEVK